MPWYQTQAFEQVMCRHFWLGLWPWLKAPSGGETRQLTSDPYCLTSGLNERNPKTAEKWILSP
jgi:hypothetical protein